jgi:hypothetical protein
MPDNADSVERCPTCGQLPGADDRAAFWYDATAEARALADDWAASAQALERERDEARAEVERLREAVANTEAAWANDRGHLTRQRDEARAEVERLRGA